ncbi:MAG: DUF4959 domain-containing protein [Prevotella sp.]|jgi:hypothetical protein|nr:DUF4959 domain-containing protein [Prevotella sp.]
MIIKEIEIEIDIDMKRMKRIFNNRLLKDMRYLLIATTLFAGMSSCEEQPRFEIGYSDSEPPGMPGVRTYKPTYGGAVIYFTPPADRDVLTIDASYVNAQGNTVWFSASYFKDSISVYGFNDTSEKTVNVYAVDRAGNKSEPMPILVTPLEPAYMQVARSVVLKAGFRSFFLEWENKLEQNINIYLDFSYIQNGERKELNRIYSSNLPEEQWFIRDLDELTENDPIDVKIRVGDLYGNITEPLDKGEIRQFADEKIPKDKWTMPAAGEFVSDVLMGYFSYGEGRASYLIDDIVDDGKNMNYGHTGGGQGAGTPPWNVLIDLGDEYEISRIITHQRFTGSHPIYGEYYGHYNIRVYNIYIMGESGEWEHIREVILPYPEGISDIAKRLMGMEGDMAYLYTDIPRFSKPTRWFRYQATKGMDKDLINGDISYWADCLSEITLYGRKAKNN